MASFKYKNMQKFVKQSLMPFIVNTVLLIKDAIQNIYDLDKKLDQSTTKLTDDLNAHIKDKNNPHTVKYVQLIHGPSTLPPDPYLGNNDDVYVQILP